MNRRKIRDLRQWAQHLALRLRKHRCGYSICPRYPDCAGTSLRQRVDFRSLSQIAPWLDKYMDAEIKRLGRER
jgi:hypothetical protein